MFITCFFLFSTLPILSWGAYYYVPFDPNDVVSVDYYCQDYYDQESYDQDYNYQPSTKRERPVGHFKRNAYKNWNLGVSAEARVVYYRPVSKRVRRIYGSGWADYQLEIAKRFSVCNGLEWSIFAGVSGFSVQGRSYSYKDKTRLDLIPISLGLKFLFPLCYNIDFFLGGAGCYSFLHIKDNSHYVHKDRKKEGWGGLAQTGFYYYPCRNVAFSLYADYLFQKFHFNGDRLSSSHSSDYVQEHTVNLDGYSVGGGISFIF